MLPRESSVPRGWLCGGRCCDRVRLSGGVGVGALRGYVGVGVDAWLRCERYSPSCRCYTRLGDTASSNPDEIARHLER